MKRIAYALVPIVMVMAGIILAAGGSAQAQVDETAQETSRIDKKSEGTSPAEGSPSIDEDSEKKDFGLEIFDGRAKLAAVPIPAYNESIGWSIGLAVAAFYRASSSDTISPESSTALFGFYAENKTWAAGFYQQLFLDEDRWRIKAGGAVADINFQTYLNLPEWLGGGTSIDYTTETTGGLAEVSRLAWKRLYLGAKYRYMRSKTEFHVKLPINTTMGKRTFSGLGLVSTWDTRDNIFYPLDGYYVNFWSLWNRDAIGSDLDYDIYWIEVNGFREYRKNHVIAARVHSRIATGDVPFEDESVFFYVDLRGYTDGRYRADQRHTLQAEYRWNFYRRFYAVGFGGFGFSVDRVSEITGDGILPSAGFGLRWRMISDPPVNIGFDYAWGKDDGAFYFRIGEAF